MKDSDFARIAPGVAYCVNAESKYQPSKMKPAFVGSAGIAKSLSITSDAIVEPPFVLNVTTTSGITTISCHFAYTVNDSSFARIAPGVAYCVNAESKYQPSKIKPVFVGSAGIVKSLSITSDSIVEPPFVSNVTLITTISTHFA